MYYRSVNLEQDNSTRVPYIKDTGRVVYLFIIIPVESLNDLLLKKSGIVISYITYDMISME